MGAAVSFHAPPASGGKQLYHGNLYIIDIGPLSDMFYISMAIPRTQLKASMPTPVSPISYISQHWPQAPILAERSQGHVQSINKQPTTFSQRQDYLPTPPASPSTTSPIPTMFTLPNEMLDHIFSFLPLASFPTLMCASSLCHALAERQLYFKIQHIQLYDSPDNEEDESWQCIRTLASRPSAATSVRHFAVRGLPWLDAQAASLLLRALSNMTQLCSLHLELGAPFERALVRDKSAVAALASLCALNVTDPETALAICGTVSGIRRSTTQAALPLAALRIAPGSPLDLSAVHDLLQALTRGQTADLQVLQMTVACESEDELLKVLGKLGKSLPFLETFGLQVRFTGGHGDCGCGMVGEEDKVSDLSRRLGNVLSLFPSLRQLSLTSCSSSVPLCIGPTQGDVEALSKGCRRLERLELQWSVWRAETVAGNQSWRAVPTSPGHSYLKNEWAYEHASTS